MTTYLESLQRLGAEAVLRGPSGNLVLVWEALVAVAAAADEQLKANRVVMQGWSKQSADELFAADWVLSGRVAALRAAVEGETKSVVPADTGGPTPRICAHCQKPIIGEWLSVDEAMYGFETSYQIHPECWLRRG